MRSRHAFGLALVALAPLGCESSLPPAPPAPPPMAGSAAALALPAAPEPSDIIVMARWKNPGATFAGMGSCANVPTPIADMGAHALIETLFGEALRGQADTRALAAEVALDAPIDGMVAIDPQSKRTRLMAAFSIGLRSFDKSKAAIETVAPLTEVAPGVFKIGEKHRDLSCVLASAGGSTPARLVCGGRDQDANQLAPYLARTAPTLPSPAQDLHAEFHWVPLEGKIGAEARQGLSGLRLAANAIKLNEPTFDKALDEAAPALADEFTAEMADLDKVSVDLSVDPKSCITIDGQLQLRARTSWLAKLLTDRPERQGPAPAMFWRLPQDSDSAFYGTSADPARFTDVLRVGRGLLEGYMVKGGVPKADAKAVADLLTAIVPKTANQVSAAGHLDPPKLTNPKPQQSMDAMMNAYFGWYLMGIDDGGDALAKWLKDAVAAYNRAAVQKQLKFHLKDAAKHMPILRVGPGPGQLGRGSVDVEIRLNDIDAPDFAVGAKKGDKVTFVGHLLVMVDGKSAWLAFGTNRDELVKRLVSVKSGAPAAGTLASRPGLEPLKNGKYLSAGYFTILPFTKAVGTGLSLYASQSGGIVPFYNEISGALNGLPHKGQSPMFMTTSLAGSDKAKVDVTFNVGKGTLDDVGSLIATGLSIANKVRGSGPTIPNP